MNLDLKLLEQMPVQKMLIDIMPQTRCLRQDALDKMPLNKMSKDIMPVDNMSVYKIIIEHTQNVN